LERSRAGAGILAAVERGLVRDLKTCRKIERERRNGGNGGDRAFEGAPAPCQRQPRGRGEDDRDVTIPEATPPTIMPSAH
jgi:hypothetical protein